MLQIWGELVEVINNLQKTSDLTTFLRMIEKWVSVRTMASHQEWLILCPNELHCVP